MRESQTHVALVAFLQGALKCAEDIEDSTTAYLIERALDEARSRQFSGVETSETLH